MAQRLICLGGPAKRLPSQRGGTLLLSDLDGGNRFPLSRQTMTPSFSGKSMSDYDSPWKGR